MLVQLEGAVVALVLHPTCTAAAEGETVPATDVAVETVAVVGGEVNATEAPATVTAAETAWIDVAPVCWHHKYTVPLEATVRFAVHVLPETVAATQLTGAVVLLLEYPTCTAVPLGPTVPDTAKGVPAVALVGGDVNPILGSVSPAARYAEIGSIVAPALEPTAAGQGR